MLDRAVMVHQVDRVWNQVGLDKAGQGIKIGIIDSGVDNQHPGLQDASMPMPEGFPRYNAAAHKAFTNSKVIVARSYVNLLAQRDPDLTPRDHMGHGTAVAMIAAGATNRGPRGSMTGVAPKAYIGSYKVFGTPTYNDSATDQAILQAIEDAVADGMDILNMSFGSTLTPRLEDDLEVKAIERAAALGVLTIVAAGNDGPWLGTLPSPATAPSAITVGASRNERVFGPSATVTGVGTMLAANSSRPGALPVTGPLVDAVTLDSTGLLCAGLGSADALRGRIVLALRGSCTFETKMNNASAAGAVGLLLYSEAFRPDPVSMSAGAASLPAQMLSHDDGMAIKRALASGETLRATLDFTVRPVSVDPRRMASFSSAGPSAVDISVKPEVVAVGTNFYTATQTFDAQSDMYDVTGYTVVDGTSFSTPLVAGIAALLKATRPGLSVDDYRSLVINTAAAMPEQRSQISGAGMVDASAAIRATVTASPAAVAFASPGARRQITLRNLTNTSDTYTAVVQPGSGSRATPVVVSGPVTVAAGGTAVVELEWPSSASQPGGYEGAILLEGSSSGNRLRVPYWFAAPTTPGDVVPLWVNRSPVAYSLDNESILIRVVDKNGVTLPDVRPSARVTLGTASIAAVRSLDARYPGVWAIDIRYQSVMDPSEIELSAGEAAIYVVVP
ncbi:hypothetical protein F183_A32470 [Bryobacterales bacterium F-183]|nr:hypothetical protein F183_A32470 [Bryobacterales bacterium F-183]